MQHDQFTDRSPGRLEPTFFLERPRGGGEPVKIACMGFVPDELPPSWDEPELLYDLYIPVIAAERNLSELEGVASRLSNPHMLISAFGQREAILSSAIEDTFASAEQLAMFDVDPKTGDERSQTREVFNYIRALEHGLESQLPVCLRLIREMHEILLEGVGKPGVMPGKFRKTQNAIGQRDHPVNEARFVPSPPSFLDALMNNIERYLNAEDSRVPRLVRFAVIHYQFETLHPFLDGNGRLGRLLIALMLCRQGQLSKPLVYVSGYFEAHRDDYCDLLLRVSTHGEWKPWIEFFVEAVRTQARDAIERANRLLVLNQEYHDRVREKRASALLPVLVDQLFLGPGITFSRVEKKLKCSHSTAIKLVNKLVEKNILSDTGRGYGKIFVCRGIIDLIHES